MFNIQLILKDPENTAAGLRKRMAADEVESSLKEVTALDEQRRALIQQVESARAAKKARGREIGALIRAGKSPDELPPLPDPKAMEAELRQVEERLNERLGELPNLPADEVPAGGKEANQVVRTHGEPPTLAEPIPHWQIAKDYDLVDFERGVAIGGSGFWMYKGVGAQLEWALLNYFVSRNIQAGYTMLLPPHIALPKVGYAAGQFPKFGNDVYHTTASRELFLIPTSETALVGAYAQNIFADGELPAKLFAYTPCYRCESAGPHSDERGTVRGHQFNKVEIFQFVKPEQAAQALDDMVTHVESLVASLGLHFQSSLLAAKDASAAMKKTIDVEVYMPSTGGYKEVSSVSWGGDYQARRAGIRFRSPEKKGTQLVQSLNGSALATSRVFPAILEQHQQADGSVVIPEVLRPFMFGVEKIEPPAKS